MRFISLEASDLRITAWVAEKNNPDVFRRISFKTSSIDYLLEVNATASAIVLKSGIVIPVWESFPTLNRRIHEPDFRDGGVLDLTAVTGEATRHIAAPKLADKFNTPSKPGLLISAILRKGGSNSAVGFDFSESDVASFTDESGTRAKTRHSVRIIFNDAVKTPFGKTATHHLDMPYADFIKELVNAKKNGLAKLDLCSLFVANPNRYGFSPE